MVSYTFKAMALAVLLSGTGLLAGCTRPAQTPREPEDERAILIEMQMEMQNIQEAAAPGQLKFV